MSNCPLLNCHLRIWVSLIICCVWNVPGSAQVMQSPETAAISLPVLRLSNGTTGIWLPEYKLGVAPATAEWPVNGLQATIILGQKSISPAVLAKASEPYLLAQFDSLARAIPIQEGIRRQYQGPSGTVQTVTREWYIRDLEKVRNIGSQNELMVFRSQQLSNRSWDNQQPFGASDSFRIFGYPLTSFFGAPNARKAAYWLEDFPFRKKILDSLGYIIPSPGIPEFDQNPSDPLTAYYRSDWPLRRTDLLLTLLEEQGDPVFDLIRTLSTQMALTKRRASSMQLLQAYGPNMEQWLRNTSYNETRTDSLATQIALYFRHTHGPSIPTFLVEQARLHQKDYQSLTSALLAKSLLFHPDQWVPDYQQSPYQVLERLEKDYGFRFFSAMLLETRATVRQRRQEIPQEVTDRLTQHYLRQPKVSLQEANGTLRTAPLTLDPDNGLLISATLLPGLSGSLVFDPEGQPYGILLVCQADAEYGQWLSPLAPSCSYIIPWETVVKDIDPQD